MDGVMTGIRETLFYNYFVRPIMYYVYCFFSADKRDKYLLLGTGLSKRRRDAGTGDGTLHTCERARAQSRA